MTVDNGLVKINRKLLIFNFLLLGLNLFLPNLALDEVRYDRLSPSPLDLDLKDEIQQDQRSQKFIIVI